VKTKYANVNMVSQNQRYLCGVEENRLGAVRDPEHLAAYLYNAGGARVWKFTGDVSQMGQSGKTVIEQVSLNNKTLYASSFFVASDHGYTKHYFAGSERVCSKLGGGLLLAPVMPTEATVEAIFEDYEQMRNRLFDLINKFANCNPHPEQQTVTYIDIEPYLGGIQDYLDRHEPEENRFFYHPDHLGSSNFITDAAGDGYQHLQYLPFGETAVSQKLSWWSTPYQFTGKEKDDETGYNYFGARYYNSDISIWLSVDPLSDKYPSMSAYMYCAGNPVMLVDPDGREIDYEKFRDRVNTFFAFVFNKNFRSRYRTWKDSPDTYTIQKRDNKPALIYARPDQKDPEKPHDKYVEYAGVSSGIDIDIDLRGRKTVTERYKILQKMNQNGPSNATNNPDEESFTISPIPGTTLILNAHCYPDYFSITDRNGDELLPQMSVATIRLTDNEQYNDVCFFGIYEFQVPQNVFLPITVTISSMYNWPGGPNKTPSIGYIRYEKYRFKSLHIHF
jgi:RHS repeat-associated protein